MRYGKQSSLPYRRLRATAVKLGCGEMPQMSFDFSSRDWRCEDSSASGPVLRRRLREVRPLRDYHFQFSANLKVGRALGD